MVQRFRTKLTATAAAIALTTASIIATASGASAAACTAVTVGTDTGAAGDLRFAINEANAGFCDTIIIASGLTVVLTSNLPAINSPTSISGDGAINVVTGVFEPNTTIDFNGTTGLSFTANAPGSSVTELALYGSSTDTVTVAGDDFLLNNAVVGLDAAGNAQSNGGAGVVLTSTSSRARIGLNALNSSKNIGNVISANSGPGILVDGSDDNTIVANLIGTDFTGDLARGNGGGGITLRSGADRNMIGGDVFTNNENVTNNPTGTKGTVTPVFIIPPLGNHISGNTGNGLTISGGSELNTLSGNFIGTSRDGNARNPNTGDGVNINNSDRNTLRGCRLLNNPFVYYNVLSGNNGDGLQVTNSDNTTVQANFFGTGANNTTRVANLGNGILVDGNSMNTQVGGVIPLGNVSAGNALNGISVRGTASKFITFNTFGGLLAFKGAMPNGRDGLYMDTRGGSNTVRTNVLSGNHMHGIEIAGNARGITIDPNIVGMTTNAKTKLPNGGHGLFIHGNANHLAIGGTKTSVIPQNIFSGNKGYGIVLAENAHHNRIIDTFVGTKVFGDQGASNSKGGLILTGRAHHNVIGAFATPRSLAGRGDVRLRPSNIISGNVGIGLTLTAGTRANVVRNNFVGVNRAGMSLRNTRGQILNRGRTNAVYYNQTTPLR